MVLTEILSELQDIDTRQLRNFGHTREGDIIDTCVDALKALLNTQVVQNSSYTTIFNSFTEFLRSIPGTMLCVECYKPFNRALLLTLGDGIFWYACPHCFVQMDETIVQTALLEKNTAREEIQHEYNAKQRGFGTEHFSRNFAEYRAATDVQYRHGFSTQGTESDHDFDQPTT